jgi:hypothetical protein
MIPDHFDAFFPTWREFQKFRRGTNLALAFATLHKQPFLLHYCGIGDLLSVASEAQTNGSPTGQGQDYRTIELQDYKTTGL